MQSGLIAGGDCRPGVSGGGAGPAGAGQWPGPAIQGPPAGRPSLASPRSPAAFRTVDRGPGSPGRRARRRNGSPGHAPGHGATAGPRSPPGPGPVPGRSTLAPRRGFPSPPGPGSTPRGLPALATRPKPSTSPSSMKRSKRRAAPPMRRRGWLGGRTRKQCHSPADRGAPKPVRGSGVSGTPAVGESPDSFISQDSRALARSSPGTRWAARCSAA